MSEELTNENGWYLLHSFNKQMPNSGKNYLWDERIKDVAKISMDLIRNRGFIGLVNPNQTPFKDILNMSTNYPQAGDLLDYKFVNAENGVINLYGKIKLSDKGKRALENPVMGFSINGLIKVTHDGRGVDAHLEQIKSFDITTVRKK